jgi:hypothetical protein
MCNATSALSATPRLDRDRQCSEALDAIKADLMHAISLESWHTILRDEW